MVNQKTKKSLLGVCALACLAGGMLFANGNVTASADAIDPASFAMVNGAQIRVYNDDMTNNGIRFVANISGADYAAITEGATNVSAGVFIMPEDFVDEYGALTEANTVAGTAYTWEGKDDQTGKKIIHVASTVVENGSDYQVKGSVVNMKTANLNRDYVGQAYICVDGTYYFADPMTDGRSTVTVAQKALINADTDAALAGDTEKQGCAKSYLSTYLTAQGGSINYDIPTDVYVENSDGVLTKDEIASSVKQVTVDSADDFLVAETASTEKADYTFIQYGSVLETYPYVDGSGALKTNYEKTSFSGFAADKVSNVIFSSAATGEGNIFERNNSKSDQRRTDLMQAQTGWSYYSGNEYCWVSGNGADCVTFTYNDPVQLPVATNQFSMVIWTKTNQFNTPRSCQMWIYYSGGYKAASFTIPVAGETARVYLNINAKIDQVTKIEFESNQGGAVQFGMDSFCWEVPYGAKDVVVNDTATTEVEVGASGILSTRYEVSDLANQVASATYTLLPSGTATPIVGDTATLDVVEKNYKVDISLTGGESFNYTVFGCYSKFITSFDFANEINSDNPLKPNIQEDYTTNYSWNYDGNKVYSTLDSSSVDGDGSSLRILSGGESWAGPKLAAQVNVNYTTICMWVYCASDRTISLSGNNGVYVAGANYLPVQSCTLVGGQWNYVEVSYTSEKTKLGDVEFDTKNAMFGGCYIDRITLR